MNEGSDIGAAVAWAVVLGAAWAVMTTPLRAAGADGAAPDEESPFRLSATAGYTYVSYLRERG